MCKFKMYKNGGLTKPVPLKGKWLTKNQTHIHETNEASPALGRKAPADNLSTWKVSFPSPFPFPGLSLQEAAPLVFVQTTEVLFQTTI